MERCCAEGKLGQVSPLWPRDGAHRCCSIASLRCEWVSAPELPNSLYLPTASGGMGSQNGFRVVLVRLYALVLSCRCCSQLFELPSSRHANPGFSALYFRTACHSFGMFCIRAVLNPSLLESSPTTFTWELGRLLHLANYIWLKHANCIWNEEVVVSSFWQSLGCAKCSWQEVTRKRACAEKQRINSEGFLKAEKNVRQVPHICRGHQVMAILTNLWIFCSL